MEFQDCIRKYFQVMQNLNCKTNAAGWLPSSSNRTAQAFSQPGKGIIPPIGGSVRLGSNQMSASNKSSSKHQSSVFYIGPRIPQNVQ